MRSHIIEVCYHILVIETHLLLIRLDFLTIYMYIYMVNKTVLLLVPRVDSE